MFSFDQDPIVNFESEFLRVSQVINKDPNAMSLATVSKEGFPSVRTVLFKGIVRGGLSFFTNYQSQKSKELTANPNAALLFFWNICEMQVRFEGQVLKMTRQESEAYFASRPRLSQIGAWASQQSEIISHREFLSSQVEHYETQFSGKSVPCPPHWGGWLLQPLRIEFWYGQQGRLHDRYLFERATIADTAWLRSMKAP